jgi:hypothetical protein
VTWLLLLLLLLRLLVLPTGWAGWWAFPVLMTRLPLPVLLLLPSFGTAADCAVIMPIRRWLLLCSIMVFCICCFLSSVPAAVLVRPRFGPDEPGLLWLLLQRQQLSCSGCILRIAGC